MEDLLLALIITVVFVIVNRTRLKGFYAKPGLKEGIFSGVLALLAGGLVYLSAAGIYPAAAFYAPLAWVLLMFIFNWMEQLLNKGLILYELLLAGLFFSFFVLPRGAFTVFFFPLSFFMILLGAPVIYIKLLEKRSLLPAFLFLTLLVFTLKFLALDGLNPYIAVPVAGLVSVYCCVAKPKPFGHYLEEPALLKYLGIAYPLLMLQCFIAAVLKNTLFM